MSSRRKIGMDRGQLLRQSSLNWHLYLFTRTVALSICFNLYCKDFESTFELRNDVTQELIFYTQYKYNLSESQSLIPRADALVWCIVVKCLKHVMM